MNRFTNFQNKLQSTVKDLNANLTDGATKLRQQIAENVQTSTLLGRTDSQPQDGANASQQPPPSPAAGDQQYIRLPIESAKKLRWFDRQDMGMLIDLHLREKQELHDANAAMRKVMQRHGMDGKQIDAELAQILETVDVIRSHDSGVNEILVLAVREELEAANDKISELTGNIELLQQKLLAAQQASPATPSPAKYARQRLIAERTPFKDAATTEATEAGGAAAAAATVEQPPPVENLTNALHVIVENAALIQSAEAAEAELVRAAASVLHPLQFNGGEATAEGNEPLTTTAPTDASSSQQLVAELEERCDQLEAQLSVAQNDALLAKESTEKKLSEARAKFAGAQQAQQDLLRVAQDRRLEAEARFEASEARAASAEAELGSMKSRMNQLEDDVKRLEKQAAEAAKKVSQAEVSVERERVKGAQQADASAQQAVAHYRSQVKELEATLLVTRQQLTAAQNKASALESRLSNAEAATARAMAEARDLEHAVADRDDLAMKLAATQARLDEIRSEQANAQSLRSLASQSEERRAQAEDELVTTAKLAATLESKLSEALGEIQASKIAVDSAENRAREAEIAIKLQVAKEWEAAGVDRARWPPTAQAELENVEARLKALNAALSAAEEAGQRAVAERQRAEEVKEEAEKIAATAKAQAERIQREFGQREQRLQAAAAAASLQVDEFRIALSKAERERDRLSAEKEAREVASKAAAAAVAAATRRGGGGSLSSETELSTPIRGTTTSSSNETETPASVFRSPLKAKETLHSTDILYMKNVLLKFIDAQLNGRYQECEVLLPAVAALLQASPGEYHVLKESLNNSSGLGWIYSSIAGSATSSAVVPGK